MGGHVYILASRRYGTLYTGVTSDLARRVDEHRRGLIPGFTREYGVKRLVLVEAFDDIGDAIVREKHIKKWRRDWKIELIERDNPMWDDLAVSLLGMEPLDPREPREPTRPAYHARTPSRHPRESGDP
jgi:putative endonuclease